jgi:hypothetical protein
MKKILLILFVFAPFLVSAQKLKKPIVDKITGDTIWTTSLDKLYLHGNYLTGQGEAIQCEVDRIGKNFVLVLIPQTLNERSVFAVGEDQKTYLKFSDNSILTLSDGAFKISDAQVSEAGGFINDKGALTLTFALKPDEIAKILSSSLTFVRFETTDGNFDCDIKPKFSDLIKKQLQLVSNAK